MATQAYCVKCKRKREMNNEKPVTMKNGRRAITGICSTCGTKMFKIGGGGGTSERKPKMAVKHATRKKQNKTTKRKKK